MSDTLKITDSIHIGDNADLGYRFGVGKVGGRWVGFAIGNTDGGGCMFMLSISPDAWLGVVERDDAIRRSAAFIQSPENGYGGFTHWHMDDSLRSVADDFRCETCNDVCCNGRCRDYEFEVELF